MAPFTHGVAHIHRLIFLIVALLKIRPKNFVDKVTLVRGDDTIKSHIQPKDIHSEINRNIKTFNKIKKNCVVRGRYCNKAAGVYIFSSSVFFFSSHSNSLVGGQTCFIFIQENVNTEENVLFMSFRNGSEDAHS